MVSGVFTPDFRAKGFKAFGYSEDTRGNENKWEKGLRSLPSSNRVARKCKHPSEKPIGANQDLFPAPALSLQAKFTLQILSDNR